MKHLGQHILETILLVAAVCIVALLPEDTLGPNVNLIVWSTIGCVLLLCAAYLYRGHKKGIFCMLLLLFMVSSATPVFADNAENYYRNKLETIMSSWKFCRLNKKFDPDKAIKENSPPDPEAVQKAAEYMDTWKQAKRAGEVKRNSKKKWGIFSSKDKYEKYERCAKEYLQKVAEYRKKKSEASLRSVQTLLKEEENQCWPCGIVSLLITAVEEISMAIEDDMKTAALQLLGIMLLFWILVKVTQLIGQFGTANNAEFFTEFLIRMTIAMIAAVFLSFPMGEVYKRTFSPLVSASTDLTQEIATKGMGLDSISSAGLGGQLAGGSYLGCKCCTEGESSDCNGGTITEYKKDGMDEGIFEKETKRQLVCVTCTVYKQMSPLVAAGRVLIYDSLHSSGWMGKTARWVAKVITLGISDYIPWPFGMWITGTILVVCFTLLSFMVAFRCIDIFIRFGFAVVLTPFLVVAYVFPISRQYTQRGWEFLLHALLSILGLAIGIAFVLSVLKASLPSTVTSNLSSLMKRTDSELGNCYAKELYYAFGSAPTDSGCNDGEGASFYVLMVIALVTLFGVNILNACGVIVEGLSGITCGVPAISGAAVMGMIKSAVRMTRTIAKVGDVNSIEGMSSKNAKKGLKSAGEVAQGDVQPGFFKKMENFANSRASKLEQGNAVQSAGKGMQSAGKSMEQAGKGMEQAGDAIEKGGKAAGDAIQQGGRATTKAGGSMIKGGAACCCTGVGAIAGVPLIIAGALVATGGAALQAGGMAVKAGSKIAGQTAKLAGKATKMAGKATKMAGKVTQRVGKITERVGDFIQKGNRLAARGWRAVGRGAARMQRGVDRLKQIPRNIKNRVSAMIPASIKNSVRRAGDAMGRFKKGFLRKTRRARAAVKYMRTHDIRGRKIPMEEREQAREERRAWLKDKLNRTLDTAVEGADNAFGDGSNRGSAVTAADGTYIGTDGFATDGAETQIGWTQLDRDDPNKNG